MGRFGCELLLIAFTVFVCVGFLLTYIIAVQQGHVTPDFPYISDTGGKAPESCVFSFVCGVGTICVLAIVYVRYKHVHHHYTEQRVAKEIRYLNYTCLVLGMASAFGFLLVGCFQNDAVAAVHFLGASLVFGCGTAYGWLQTLLSIRLYHTRLARHAGWVILSIRVALCVLCTLFFTAAIVTGVLANKYHNIFENAGGSFKWSHNDGGFPLHVTSTSCEWAAAISFILFFLTLHPDFKQLRVDIAVRLRGHHGDTPTVINEYTPLTI